ncbi:MAG: aldo/keto reductase [Paraclostridium sp.]|uniref:aldo/keto reductase n=1 Tax=Paraclostridium sp. TaxID=2023273 RepID=UPI003F3BE061
MEKVKLGNSEIEVSQIGLGCMRIANLEEKKVNKLINTALDNGINFFDHADIYGAGKSEEVFSKAINMNEDLRENIIIQSKCGIVPGIMYDSSKKHILESVDNILKRLDTTYLDVLLIHRPDILVEPEEVAETFRTLKESGKVKHFGVSNHTSLQIELLNKYLDEKLIVNQLQFGIMHTGMLDFGVNMNMENKASINRDGEILNYCRLNDITVQAWSPYQYGFFDGCFIDNEKFEELNVILKDLAEKYAVSKTAIATAFISRHPAKIQTIAGTTSEKRVIEIAKSTEFSLTREEWYKIYKAAGNKLP